jgi:hypothetical protein
LQKLKKITAILFLFSFLCANTVFGQLLKLPALFEHYHAHTSHNLKHDHHISLWKFVKDHYSEASKHSGTSTGDHENLPFKHMDCQGTNGPACSPQYIHVDTAVPVFDGHFYKATCSQHDYTSGCLDAIWQPPRFS